MRIKKLSRKTKETQITLSLNIDGVGDISINTEISFFNHILKSLATHSSIDIHLEAKGDLHHHIIEDVAICLGKAFRETLGEGSGIARFGYAIVPMDCSLALASVDLVKRPYSKLNLKINGETLEDITREDIIHFFETLSVSMQANIHLWVLYGQNDHHKVEAATKALALSIKQAVTRDPRMTDRIPSAKGMM